MHSIGRLRLFGRMFVTVKDWPTYLLNRLGRLEGRSRVRLRMRNGITIIGRPFSIDRSIINEEWLDRCYEPNDFGIKWNWNSCHLIIDIGAHIGTFTIYAASKSPHARVIAFEPAPDNAQILRENIDANHLSPRVEAVEAAVADRDGHITLHVTFDKSASGGHSIYDYTGKGKPVDVPMVSLQSILEKESHVCDFLKIDCEGAEYDMLYTLPDSLFSKIRLIALEYHHFSTDPTHNGPSLKAFLESKNFEVTTHRKSLFFAVNRSIANP